VKELMLEKHPSHWTNMLRGIFPGETSMIRLMGSLLMEIHEKWVTGKKYFAMERYEADKEEARKAMQLDSNELNHTDQLTA